MTLTRWNFTTGAAGDACTGANTGADSFITTGGTGVLSTDQAIIGTRSALMTASATSGALYLQKSVTVTSGLGIDMYLYLTAAPAAEVQTIIGAYAGSSRQVSLALNPDRTLRLRDGAATTIWPGTVPVPLNTWVRIAFYAVQNSTTGQVRAAWYTGHSTTAQDDSTLLTGRNTGATAYSSLRLGLKGSTGTQTPAGYVGSWAYDPDATGLPAPYGNPAPLVTITGTQNVTAAATVNVSVTATDDGSVASYAWTVVAAKSTSSPTLTGGTTSAVSFTAPSAGGLVTLQCVVTDDLGATTTVTTEVRVPISGGSDLRPLALNGTGVGAWTIAGGSATDGASGADESDTTYLESPTLTSTETSKRLRLQPSPTRSSGAAKLRLWTDTGTATATVRLYEGDTLRQAWTQALTTTATEYTFNLDGGTISAVTDWGNLLVEVAATS